MSEYFLLKGGCSLQIFFWVNYMLGIVRYFKFPNLFSGWLCINCFHLKNPCPYEYNDLLIEPHLILKRDEVLVPKQYLYEVHFLGCFFSINTIQVQKKKRMRPGTVIQHIYSSCPLCCEPSRPRHPRYQNCQLRAGLPFACVKDGYILRLEALGDEDASH